jgi:small ligand-binding sensory domain FIST
LQHFISAQALKTMKIANPSLSPLYLSVVSLLMCTTTNISAFQLTPNGGTDPPKLSPSAGIFLDEQVGQADINTRAAKNSFQSTSALVKSCEDFEMGLQELLRNWSPPKSAAVGFLFVSPSFSSNLQALVKSAHERLGDHTQFLTVVGGGVVGDGEELEDACGLSFLGGLLPEASSVELFYQTDGQKEKPPSFRTANKNNLIHEEKAREPSHLVFADPHCREIRSLLQEMEGIIAGGISVADPSQSSLAIGMKVLPPGSLIGATFLGNIGLEVVVSQGCRAVGDTFRVTSVDGPCVHELDSQRAIDKLNEIMTQVMEGGGDVPNIKSHDFLGGIHTDDDADENRLEMNRHSQLPRDFVLRKMTGFRPRSGSILICGPQIETGDFFRFHVQSKEIALEDWRATLQQARTERLFLGEQAGRALGAFQISCMGRGKSLFGVSNVDLQHIEQLLPPNTPVSGLMANAEIGPVGIRLGANEICRSVLHGFASVVAMLCDYTYSSAALNTTSSCLGNSTVGGSWE